MAMQHSYEEAMKMQHGREQSDSVVTVHGGRGGSAARRANQTADMPNTEHNNWGVCNWTHSIFLQG